MPSKFSDQLKQAIIYIKAGELEIAKEIIMEIIQNDPEYEKSWIWLLETIPSNIEKADILKTRIEQFPDSSPLAHRALQKIALELLDDYSTEKEPPSTLVTSEEDPEEKETAVTDIESEALIKERLEPVEEDDTEFEDIESLFEESIKDEKEFLAVDKFDQLLQDEIEEKKISDDDLDMNLLIDEEDYDELLEQDLEQFLQNDLNEGYFKKNIKDKPDRTEEIGDDDIFEFDSFLQEEEDEKTGEEDEFSSLLSQYTDTEEEAPAQPENNQSNPFILSLEESIHLFGEDVTETSKTNEEGENTSQSSNAFSEEGLKELKIDSDEFEKRLGLLSDDEMIFPDRDKGPAESVNANDMRHLLEDEVTGEDVVSKSSPLLKSPKKRKKKGTKGKKDRRTFMVGCSIIGVIILLALLGLGLLFLKNWQLRPQEPTLIVLPSATPTEEVSLEYPWLEEETEFSTFAPSESEI